MICAEPGEGAFADAVAIQGSELLRHGPAFAQQAVARWDRHPQGLVLRHQEIGGHLPDLRAGARIAGQSPCGLPQGRLRPSFPRLMALMERHRHDAINLSSCMPVCIAGGMTSRQGQGVGKTCASIGIVEARAQTWKGLHLRGKWTRRGAQAWVQPRFQH